MGCIVLSHESESTKLIQVVGWWTSAWQMGTGIISPAWDMGVRILIVMAGNWELGFGLIHDIGWDWFTTTFWPQEELMMIAKIDLRIGFPTLWPIDLSIFFSYFACLYRFDFIWNLSPFCISLSNRESSLTITEIESVLEALVSNFCSSFIESDYKFTFLD